MPETTKVRAKMKCQGKFPAPDGSVVVHLFAVYSPDANSENRAFSDATPSAHCQLHIAKDKPAADAFVPGQDYYVDFTPVAVGA